MIKSADEREDPPLTTRPTPGPSLQREGSANTGIRMVGGSSFLTTKVYERTAKVQSAFFLGRQE